MRIFKLISILCIIPTFVFAQPDMQDADNNFANNDGFQTVEEILAEKYKDANTPCASEVFGNALHSQVSALTTEELTNLEDSDEAIVKMWAKQIFQSPQVIEQILQCPEITKLKDTDKIVFTPVKYTFPAPSGRELLINYSTYKKILIQRMLLAGKKSTPTGNVSEKVDNEWSSNVFINTDPAWYGVLVVQHNSLSEFVGPDKNNTVSLQYIHDHIGNIYPEGYHCTSKSAIAWDSDIINQTGRRVVGLGNADSNDYYVAGDIDLSWVMYAEIAIEVVVTVASFGAGTAIMAAAKGFRAARATKNVLKSVKALTKIDKVQDYIKVTKKLGNIEKEIAKLTKEVKTVGKNTDRAKDINKRIDVLKQNLAKTKDKSAKLIKEDKNVSNYVEQTKVLSDVQKYRHALRSPKTGNVFAKSLRGLKAIRAAGKGSKTISKASKIGRGAMSSRSAKIGDFLFENSLKHAGALTKAARDTSLAMNMVLLAGDLFDRTSSSTDEFTNGIEFTPYCLLSADDLEGQENVVNYGMWFLWEGDSISPANDDAAYLQAMDFASKFHHELIKVQEEKTTECNVDIYVVRPIIFLDEENPKNSKMYYLFMNDVPWTTAVQFGEHVPDIEEWRRTQAKLEQEKHKPKTRKEAKEMENKNNNSNETENNNTENNESEPKDTTEEDLKILKDLAEELNKNLETTSE